MMVRKASIDEDVAGIQVAYSKGSDMICILALSWKEKLNASASSV